MYRTIRDPRLRLSEPRPFRQSKYLIHSGAPRVSIASFDVESASSLARSLAKAGVRREGTLACLSAIERLVVAALPTALPTANSGTKATPKDKTAVGNDEGLMVMGGSSDEGDGSRVVVARDGGGERRGGVMGEDGTRQGERRMEHQRGLMPVLGQFAPPPLPAGSVEAGTARAKIASPMGGVTRGSLSSLSDSRVVRLAKALRCPVIGTNTAVRLLSSFYALKYRSTALAASVLSYVHLGEVVASKSSLVRLAEIAVAACKLGLPVDSPPMRRVLALALPALAPPAVPLTAPSSRHQGRRDRETKAKAVIYRMCLESGMLQ